MSRPWFSLGGFLFGLIVGATVAGYWRPPSARGADMDPATVKASGPPDATWCPFLAYDRASDSFRCADDKGRFSPTLRSDLPFCPFLIQDHGMDGFKCAERDEGGSLVKRVWLPGPGP